MNIESCYNFADAENKWRLYQNWKKINCRNYEMLTIQLFSDHYMHWERFRKKEYLVPNDMSRKKETSKSVQKEKTMKVTNSKQNIHGKKIFLCIWSYQSKHLGWDALYPTYSVFIRPKPCVCLRKSICNIILRII